MELDHGQKMQRAVAPVLRDGSTFTRAWFMTRPHMTASFWRCATVVGLSYDGYRAVAGDVNGQVRGLLTIKPADAPGVFHLARDDKDQGKAYQMTPYGRFSLGPPL